jgi:hypothetical protein
MAHTARATATDPERVRLSSYPDARRQQYDVAPGVRPVFSRDGRELFYIADGALWSVPIQYEPSFRIGTPARVSDGTHRYTWAHPHPDGERFLMIRDAATEDGAASAAGNRFRLHVVVNWAEELERRVPTR